MTTTKTNYSKLLHTAVERVQILHGRSVRFTVGPVIYKALVAEAALDLLAAQDDDVPAERVRELLLMVHGDIASLA